jgi:hypothetical protein
VISGSKTFKHYGPLPAAPGSLIDKDALSRKTIGLAVMLSPVLAVPQTAIACSDLLLVAVQAVNGRQSAEEAVHFVLNAGGDWRCHFGN